MNSLPITDAVTPEAVACSSSYQPSGSPHAGRSYILHLVLGCSTPINHMWQRRHLPGTLKLVWKIGLGNLLVRARRRCLVIKSMSSSLWPSFTALELGFNFLPRIKVGS